MPFTEGVRLTATDIAIDEEFHTGVWMVQSICITLKSTSALTKTHERFVPGTPCTTRGQLCQEKLLTTNVYAHNRGKGCCKFCTFYKLPETWTFCLLPGPYEFPFSEGERGVSLLGRK